MHRTGFTLIELVVVITIVGILAVAVLINGSAKGPVRLEAACQRLAMDLRYCQQMAMAEQVRFGISFDTGDESYFGYRISTATKARDPQTQGDLGVDFDETDEFKEIEIVSTNFGNAIEFDSIGKPYNASGVALSSEGIITLQVAAVVGARRGRIARKTVRIEPNTGKVSIQSGLSKAKPVPIKLLSP